MNQKLLKNNPFGYKNSKELFLNIVKKKFDDLVGADIEQYYDFIFSAGALRDWISKEFNMCDKEFKDVFLNDKYFSIFHSIYNNTKHYTLTDSKQKYYIVLDGKSIGKANENGEIILQDDTILFDEGYLMDKIFGDDGDNNIFCSITNSDKTYTENIYLFEICKQVYKKYNCLIQRLYPN